MVKVFSSNKTICLTSNLMDYQQKKDTFLVRIHSLDELEMMYDELVTKNHLLELYFYHEDEKLLLDSFSSHFKIIEAAGGLVRNKNGEYLFIFRNGEFKIKDYEKSKKIARQLLAIWKVVPINDNIVFRSFFTLLTRCNEFDVNVFLDKMQYQSKKFKKQRDVKLQIEVIEDIYNFRNRSKINLRIIK